MRDPLQVLPFGQLRSLVTVPPPHSLVHSDISLQGPHVPKN